MENCRNCGSSQLKQLGFTGILAPFFLKRVFRAEVVSNVSTNPLKKLIQQVSNRLTARISKHNVAVELQFCQNCSFVQTRVPFEDNALGNLYFDYRSDSYNRERIHYEPSYAAIATNIGRYSHNGQDRVGSLTSWLSNLAVLKVRTMLDYGGADGQYLPDLPGEKFVYEISDIPPATGVMRIAEKKDLQQYEYVQISHVLEHVPHPLEMVKEVASYIAKNGYIMIEVPQDAAPDVLKQVQTGTRMVLIHEHINLYSVASVTALMEAAGLKVEAVELFPIVASNWTQYFVRGLARRTS